MIRKIDITKSASNFLSDLPPKQCKQNFMTVLQLSQNPQPHDARKLQGFDEFYRVDIGEYRIIYRFDDETLYVALIGKRNDDDVYKQLKRKL